MNPGHELVSTANADAGAARPATPPEAAANATAEPIAPGLVLKWIAAAGTEPWFPSVHARLHGANRDALDEPLARLRTAELIRVANWVRGMGQGFVLTPAGESLVSDPAALERLAVATSPSAATAAPALDADTAEAAPLHPNSTAIEYRTPIVTPVLIAANLLWFFGGWIIATQAGVSSGDYLGGKRTGLLHRLGAVSAPDLIAGQWWRLLSSCFVHAGSLHLLGNMLALGMMGPLAELLWGRWRVVTIYAFAGLAGSCLAMAIHPIDSERGAIVVLAGASGAIWGLQTSLLAWLMLYRQFIPEDVAADLFRRLGIALMVNVGVSLLPDISWQAHLGGGLAGFTVAIVLTTLRFGDRPRRIWAAIMLAAFPTLCVCGLIASMQSGDAWAKLRTPPRPRPDPQAAIDAYNQNVAPVLLLLAPEVVNRVELDAKYLLARSVRKVPATAPQLRSRVEQLRATAADAVTKLSEPPTGIPALDAKRAKAKAFAEARLKSFELLLKLIDAPTDAALYDEWIAASAEAQKLWLEFGAK